MIDIPELQLIAVIGMGFFLGVFALPHFSKRPVLFSLIAGILFFGIRFIPAYAVAQAAAPGTIPGNGIISAAVMWVVFIASMLLGDLIVRRNYGEYKEGP